MCLVLGNSNSACFSNERIGVGGRFLPHGSGDSIGFSNPFSQMDLIDLTLLERNFTWFELNDEDASRLDRFLVSGIWCEFDTLLKVIKTQEGELKCVGVFCF